MHYCIHTYIHTCMHACMHTYMHACIHTYIHTYVRACVRACVRGSVRAYVRTCVSLSDHRWLLLYRCGYTAYRVRYRTVYRLECCKGYANLPDCKGKLRIYTRF